MSEPSSSSSSDPTVAALTGPAIAQSAAFAVQDAVAYLRSIETLCAAATSVALRLAADGDEEGRARVMELAHAALQHARTNYEELLRIAEISADDVSDGPSGIE